MTATIPALSSQYDPAATEAKWQETWETNAVFQADPDRPGDPYCIVIPPPNVTGSLHMGHAFESALIDVLVRYHRMIGRNTLWLPGTDHASIAVHSILGKQLQAEGTTREEIGRDQFLARAWHWKAESGGTIVNQLRRLGVSVDWSRERFTMDEGLSQAVIEAFVQLYQEGLIYRGNYMVNWCPASQSAVSDQEVENQDVDGHLWHFRYPLSDDSGALEVATTRPETMLGDTAVAVNPEDERYQHLIGQTVRLPIMDRHIPIIADEFVDPSFGTGCVKVTPAHDPNDFEMGQRHNLPLINILHKDGSLNQNAGPFEGQDRFAARKQVVERLGAEGYLVKVEDYHHSVPYSDRGKVPVEPLLSTQWFVNTEPLAQKTLAFLDQDQSPRFVPERWTKVYRDWLVNLKNWCISRQLWWGHQIPAWYAISETDGEIREQTPFFVARSEADAREAAIAQFGPDVQLQQDPDVLDTWFSSGLWPFSTLGWPQQTQDLARYYPTSTLVTGFDIIFFWVARMTLMASYFTGQMPFRDVYIHGLVRDENNKKMSKSANNGIDPLILINQYGTDALRYTLVREVAGAGQDIRLEYDRKTDESASVAASRNFANKLWNASRFVLLNLDEQTPDQLGQPSVTELELADRWIISRYHRLVQQTRTDIDAYGLGEAAKGLYEFIWGDFCDWYIELVKPRLRQSGTPSRRVAQQTLAYVLEGTLKLLHPFMPHITEEIWQTLTQADGQFLAVQSYPDTPEIQWAAELPPTTVVAESVPAPESTSPTTAQPEAEPVTMAQVEIVPTHAFHWKNLLAKVQDLPEQTVQLVQRYRKALTILAIALAILLVLTLVASVVQGVGRVPLLGALFKLVGLFAAVRFTLKNLLWYEDRQAFFKSFQGQTQLILPVADAAADYIESTVPASLPTAAATSEAEAAPAMQTPSASPVPDAPPPMTVIDAPIEDQFDLLIGAIRTIRNLRAEANIKPSQSIHVMFQSERLLERQILTAGQTYIQDLVNVESVTITPALDGDQQQTIVGVVGTVQVLIPLSGVVDVEALRAKLTKALAKAEAEVKSCQGRLQNPKFVAQAPPAVVQGARDSLAEAQKQVEILRDRLNRL